MSAALISRLGQALHRYGTPAHRLEDVLNGLGRALDEEIAVFSTPTLLMFRLGPEVGGEVVLLRVHPSEEADLDRLADLDHVADGVSSGRLTTEEALAAVTAIEEAPSPYPVWAVWAARGLISAAVATFFGGHGEEAAAAAALGWAVGALGDRYPGTEAATPGRMLLSALLAAAVAAQLSPWVRPPLVFVSGLIMLVPGLGLTTGLAELATRNLVSGTARLMSAFLAFLQLIVGFAFIARLDPRLLSSPGPGGEPLPDWLYAPALLSCAVGLQVLFRAKPRHLAWVTLSVLTSVSLARVAADGLGPELGAAVAALGVGLVGNVGARWLRRPAVIGILPGLLLLVPGSLGVHALSAFVGARPIDGIDIGFSVALTGVSLVSGLFLANVVVSPRRSL